LGVPVPAHAEEVAPQGIENGNSRAHALPLPRG
jgi:hypothetical protein